MSKWIQFLCPWLLLLASGAASAIDIQPSVKGKHLHAGLSNISYPDRFITKEVNSGLPNQVTVWMTLSEGGKQLHLVNQQLQITYDLWDEVYRVQVNGSGQTSVQFVATDNRALQQRLRHLQLGQLTQLVNLNPALTYRLSAQVIVNPVQTERIRKIQAWLASSKGFTPSEASGDRQNTSLMRASVRAGGQDVTPETGGVRSSGPRFKKLFDQILEQHMDDDIPALWRSDVVVVEFQPEQLSNESQGH